jgi:hypothetical protein
LTSEISGSSATFWKVPNEFYINPGCTQFGPPANDFDVYGPADFFSSIPVNSAVLLDTALGGTGSDLQSLVYQPLNISVNKGDCLVHLVTVAGMSSVSAENQVRALIQPQSAAAQLPPSPGYAAQPMYRYYDTGREAHIFSASLPDGLHAPGLVNEGVGFNFLAGAGMPGTAPIYRCNRGSRQFISVAPDCEGARVEGMYGSLYTSQYAGTQPIYRTYNISLSDHLETPNLNEALLNKYGMELVLGFGP